MFNKPVDKIMSIMYRAYREGQLENIFSARIAPLNRYKIVNPFKPEFIIVMFIHYKSWIAVAILNL